MTDAGLDRLLDAVLHEGYLLYPYRPSVKNRRRWTFGGLYPEVHTSAQEAPQPCLIRAEVLLEAPPTARLRASVNFLKIEDRSVGKRPARTERPEEPDTYPRVPSLQARGVTHVPWQEGLRRDFRLESQELARVAKEAAFQLFLSPADRRRELLRDHDQRVVGDLIRSTAGLCVSVKLSAEPLGRGVHRVSFIAANRSKMSDPADPEEAERTALMSTHVVLETDAGRFLSQTDPPPEWAEASRASKNVGLWPVLVGPPGASRTVLGSPIILPDHPRIAPESPGDLFDGTEIDEILSLRIDTLTLAEKWQMTALDPKARHLLERTEAQGPRERSALHGTWRSPSEAPHAG